MSPKVFVSYSWTSPAHQARVRGWAEGLIGDGVEVILDVFDLKEGHDKYAFMEKMVTDPTVTHVLVFSDKSYAEKADERAAGVGTESQIISREVYEKVDQEKFIPIVCEKTDNDEPCLPTFLKARIWIDFSSPETATANWERLIRFLYGKPLFEKPPLGKPPAYLADEPTGRASPASSKFYALRQAIVDDRKGRVVYRQAFLVALFEHVDSLRVRKEPSAEDLKEWGAKVLETSDALRPSRNLFVDWVTLECSYTPTADFGPTLLEAFEYLLELKARPAELSSFNNLWFDAHSLFAYEAFLYTVAVLLDARADSILHDLFHAHYIKPQVDRVGSESFVRFDAFNAYAEALQTVLASPGTRLLSPAAALVLRNADRPDVPFQSVMEADLLAFLMGLVLPDAGWVPQTLHQARYGYAFPFFLRASQRSYFKRLATITGIPAGETLRESATRGLERLNPSRWGRFMPDITWGSLNLERLDTLS